MISAPVDSPPFLCYNISTDVSAYGNGIFRLLWGTFRAGSAERGD
ncbi:hypothetical protein HMPREF1986_00439 [Oribacterium sp. oral taxon 078 str. F0263]|nr:hypothetical protein HMPREF1986_00439 [Oribacterium sp. oral taxon 078 str. F0263]